jgi:hypothetical protein
MMTQGYSGRLIDLYGTLLGLVSVALFDDVKRMNPAGWPATRCAACWRTRPTNTSPSIAGAVENRPTSKQLGELMDIAAAPLMNPANRMQTNLLGEDDDVSGDDEEPNRLASARGNSPRSA